MCACRVHTLLMQLRNFSKRLIPLVQLGGLEPPTSCSTDRRSNQLSYNCILASRASGRPERADRGGLDGAETRCNGRFWQGRKTLKSRLEQRYFQSKTRALGPGFLISTARSAQAAGV